ncbi:hypothetical protein [Streptosporangium sp. KLBMP 9127]|nr:hypothetical protein [Streptosporangium sp. KLBMP 9127]
MTDPTIDRRRVLAAAALGRNVEPAGHAPGEGDPLHAIIGEVRDISPHLIIVETAEGEEERLVIAPWATAWRGATVAATDVPVGAHVILRAIREGRVVDRIWADITRITGTIISIEPEGKDQVVVLDSGPHRGRRTVTIPYRASGRLRVRHPNFEPGYLFDAIGTRDGGGCSAQLPATSQPAYRATSVPHPPPAYGGAQSRISGTITWSDSFDEDERGAAYPQLERSDAGCEDSGISCVGLPYLSLGSMLTVKNVCTARSCVMPIIACGCLAGRFCDRCVECGTSPRGRVAELSPISFVELGGELTKGCFNARVGLG